MKIIKGLRVFLKWFLDISPAHDDINPKNNRLMKSYRKFTP